jgi:chromosome segregation ATPase
VNYQADLDTLRKRNDDLKLERAKLQERLTQAQSDLEKLRTEFTAMGYDIDKRTTILTSLETEIKEALAKCQSILQPK